MNWYPKLYLNNIKEITPEILKKYQLKGLILDVDNTLIDYHKNILMGAQKWIKQMEQEGIKLCIVSNSNQKEKVEKVAQKLEIPYIYFAFKPLKFGFHKAQKIMQLESKQIGVVGDQILTDVIGANRCHMFSILVKPLHEKDIWITKLKRPLENKIIQNYEKYKQEENTKK